MFLYSSTAKSAVRLAGRSDDGLSSRVRTFQHANLSFFLFKFRPLRRTPQQARLPTAVEMGTGICLGLLLSTPPRIGVGSALPKKGCLVTCEMPQSAAAPSSAHLRPVKPGRLRADCRLIAPSLSVTCYRHRRTIAEGIFEREEVTCAKEY